MLGITSNIVGGFNRDDNIIAKINKINQLWSLFFTNLIKQLKVKRIAKLVSP
jgi:hypothetical protein